MLRCSPWPYIDAVIGGQTISALSLVLSTTLNVQGRLEYTLDQSVEFFTNVQVQTWTPSAALLETVDAFVAITGTGFVDSTALECRWYENGSAGLALVSALPAKFISSTKTECTVTGQLFNQTSM